MYIVDTQQKATEIAYTKKLQAEKDGGVAIDEMQGNLMWIGQEHENASEPNIVKYYSFWKLSLFYHNIDIYCGVYVYTRTTLTKYSNIC